MHTCNETPTILLAEIARLDVSLLSKSVKVVESLITEIQNFESGLLARS